MRIFVGVVGALQMIGGVLIYMVAKSAIHEILAAVAFGLGNIGVGIAWMIAKQERQLAIFDKLGKPKD